MTEKTLETLRNLHRTEIKSNANAPQTFYDLLSPETRLCPKFDQKGIAKYELASQEKMGFRVVDNITQEHIQ